MDSAKVFMTGRSQAVRLPKAYRFDADEVLIERLPDGAILLRAKARLPLGERLRAILQGLPEVADFSRPEQPALERDTAWWAAHGDTAATRDAGRRRKARTKR